MTRLPRRFAGVAVAAGLALGAVACTSSGEPGSTGTTAASGTGGSTPGSYPSASRAEVIGQLTDLVIVPAYRDLETKTAELADAVTALCAAPSATTLEAAQQAWRAANAAFYRTEAFRFGPAMDLRAAAAIDFPADAKKIDKLLAASEPPTPFTPAALDEKGSDVRGLEAIEHVLFSPGAPGDLDARRCSYAQAAADLVAKAAAQLRTAWTDGVDGGRPYAERMHDPGSAGTDEQMIVSDLVNGVIAATVSITDKRLGRADGEITGEPEDVDTGPAHATLDEVHAILESVVAVLGGNRELGGAGLIGLLAGSPGTIDELKKQAADAGAAIDGLPKPLADIPESELGTVKQANLQVRALRLILRTEVASQLGVTMTFSDSDGDS